MHCLIDGIFEILSYLFCIFVMDRIGRRLLLTFFLLLAGLGLMSSVLTNIYAEGSRSRKNIFVLFFLVAIQAPINFVYLR